MAILNQLSIWINLKKLRKLQNIIWDKFFNNNGLLIFRVMKSNIALKKYLKMK